MLFRSKIESLDAILFAVACRQDQDAAGLRVGAQALQHLKSVHPRQSKIQHDQVEMFFGGTPQGQLACRHVVDGISGVAQRAGEAISERLVVFNQ